MSKKKGTAVTGARDGEGFRKFQRKIRIGAIIRAVLFGLSLGLITVAVWLLMDKLTTKEPDYLRYAIVAAAVAVVAGAVMAIVLLPTRRRLAKRLDNVLTLGEKVQTMVAFAGEDGPMLEMQRMDTDRILRETPKRRVKGTCTWLFALLPLLAVLGMAGTILVPAKEPPAPQPVDKTWFLSTLQETALKELIREVEASDMEALPKIDTVTELETLLKRLKGINKESAMKKEVVETITDVHTIVSDHNTYELLAAQLALAPSEVMRELADHMGSLDQTLISETMQALREDLGTPGQANLLSVAIRQAVQASGIPATNEAVAAMNALADDLEALPADADENTRAALVDKHDEAINSALALQAANETVERMVINELLSIFGIAKTELPEDLLAELNQKDDSSEGLLDDDQEADKGNSGGAGDGAQLFGSNDTVYDPDRGDYVTYGEVINTYYAKITEMLADGASPEEIEKALSGYYAILYDGSKNQNKD